MKRIIAIITIAMLITLSIFTTNTYAATLDTINVSTDKTTVHPEEEVKVTVEFGQELGAYTFEIAYDNSIFEYSSAEGGVGNDTTDKVKVVYHDSTGGTNPRSNMSVTFKAKADITTSNPTEFTVTAEGLANPDASVTYDDITTPIVKNVTVEPQYVDYTLTLEHEGNIIKGKENAMTLSYSSTMGRYYEHARLIAEATTPQGANVKLIGVDEQSLEHDIIQSGWGDAQGYKIGGKDVLQKLQLKGIFSEIGDYTITLKLIDRDNSDTVIAEKTFNFTATEEQQTPPEPTTPEQPETPAETQQPENAPNGNKEMEEVKNDEIPNKLPKTGMNIYVPVIAIFMALVIAYICINKKIK